MASLASFSRMGARLASTAARTAPRTAMQVRSRAEFVCDEMLQSPSSFVSAFFRAPRGNSLFWSRHACGSIFVVPANRAWVESA